MQAFGQNGQIAIYLPFHRSPDKKRRGQEVAKIARKRKGKVFWFVLKCFVLFGLQVITGGATSPLF
ncbi:MAG: hypothetical protein QGI15_04340 [Candidatus Scalindua sp.]|nr:hypothetical protein [Candidatus Scalindua sp.]